MTERTKYVVFRASLGWQLDKNPAKPCDGVTIESYSHSFPTPSDQQMYGQRVPARWKRWVIELSAEELISFVAEHGTCVLRVGERDDRFSPPPAMAHSFILIYDTTLNDYEDWS